MGKGKKRTKKNKGSALFGPATDQAKGNTIVATLTEGGLLLLAAIAAGGAGAALGKHSLIAGVPITLFGIHKKNKYIVAAGLGLTLSNGFQPQSHSPETTQGVEGFDVKQIASQAKERMGTFFKNFSEKLYLSPKKEEHTSGLSGDEQVTYFVNPYANSELDMSALDRVQEQIANMSNGTSGLDAEREF